MAFKSYASGILGMNARNLLYLNRYNSGANKHFADDKIFTKRFLQSRNIGVAKLFHVIKHHRDLTPQFFEALPDKFVLKPNRGFAGGGIMVITEKQGPNWLTASGRVIDPEHLFLQCVDILEGKYSISGVHDDVIFEEVLEPHTDFRVLTQVGLSDVRVIVFNKVPIMAMLRVPTAESDGKANMELGAIGMGIDIGSGKTTGAAIKGKTGTHFIRRLPNGEPAAGFQIPYWEDILLDCAKIQQYTKIGFLGVDLVITKTGVKVLEINARPGLKIQIANKIPLRRRLEKISDLKVLSAEDGVKVAKKLFSEKLVQPSDFHQKPIIGIKEHVMLNTESPQRLIAQISLGAQENIIDSALVEKGFTVGDITIGEKRLKIPFTRKTIKEDYDMVISAKYLKDFYIDPNKKLEKEASEVFASVENKVLKNLDEKLCELDAQIKILSQINPQNLQEQKELFFAHKNYNPRFIYREFNIDTDYFRKELKRFPKLNHPLFPLYEKKIIELRDKIEMLAARDTNEFQDFSQKVYGKVSRHLYQQAVEFVQQKRRRMKPDTSEELDLKKAMEVLQEFLDVHSLKNWRMKILEDSVADIQVTKKESILLKKGATFQKNRLQALLIHEIGTHVFRFENGKRQPLRIFERGTAGYLQTEEGLAVYNQNALGLTLGDKAIKSALLVIAIYMGEKMGFADLFQYLRTTYRLDDEMTWSVCIKVKRGYGDTNQKGTFTKDKVYFAGNLDVEKYLKKGKIEDLYVGKIAIEDLPYMEFVEGLKKPMFLLGGKSKG
ncbi:MAG TPA: tyrosine/phenylalanine carboxypeptidase domain-containing protein [Candidatus Gracilibacteria bacterium]